MAGILDKIYAVSPLWLQNIGVSLYGYAWRHRRFGGNFTKYVADFVAREHFSALEWEAYQTEELRKLLIHAVRNAPYYRQHADYPTPAELSDFRLDQLPELPLLEKNSVRANSELFVVDNISRRQLKTYHTSGTTGTPLAIKFTSDMARRSAAAYEARVRRWAGVNYKMSRAMIGGRLVVPQAHAKPPFWRYNSAEKQLYMSAFHISPENAPFYVEALNHYQPDYLVGYASSHFFLARMINEQGLTVFRPKAVLTSSEKLTPEMRAAIETAYSCPVFDAYSGVEACCQASECEHHQLHISPDMGIVELLDEDGQPVAPGQVGEIVATGLLNFEQPLIRYRTGDLAIWSTVNCSCGRAMPVLEELVGRLEDTVIGPDGREMVRFHGIFIGLPNIVEGQIIQETIEQMRIRLVVEPGFNDHDRAAIYKRVAERLGPVEIRLEFVDHIERTARGKYRAVISHVQRNR
jgi:phenylacetate-CoA ligase